MDPTVLDVTLFTTVKTIINEVGFPIFVSVYLLYMKNKQDQAQAKLIDELKCVQEQLTETKLQIGQQMTGKGGTAQ